MCRSVVVELLCVCIHQSHECGMYGFYEFVVCVMLSSLSLCLNKVVTRGHHAPPYTYRAYLTVTKAM